MTSWIGRLEQFLNENAKNKQSDIADELYGIILNKYGSELLTIKNNGTPELNRS